MPSYARNVGLISDTHGLVRPEALQALAGCDLLLHAGDVGGPHVLAELRELAPLLAVRGNNDHGAWAQELPLIERVELGHHRLLLVHEQRHAASEVAAGDLSALVHGHSHRPRSERRPDGLLVVNPGSAGPRRFRLPVSVARLVVTGERLEAEIVELRVAPAARDRP